MVLLKGWHVYIAPMLDCGELEEKRWSGSKPASGATHWKSGRSVCGSPGPWLKSLISNLPRMSGLSAGVMTPSACITSTALRLTNLLTRRYVISTIISWCMRPRPASFTYSAKSVYQLVMQGRFLSTLLFRKRTWKSAKFSSDDQVEKLKIFNPFFS